MIFWFTFDHESFTILFFSVSRAKDRIVFVSGNSTIETMYRAGGATAENSTQPDVYDERSRKGFPRTTGRHLLSITCTNALKQQLILAFNDIFDTNSKPPPRKNAFLYYITNSELLYRARYYRIIFVVTCAVRQILFI